MGVMRAESQESAAVVALASLWHNIGGRSRFAVRQSLEVSPGITGHAGVIE
jgi:hypothetical protein